MSELQLGLLAIGVILVVGVFAYNRRQERVARRAAESGLRGGPAEDALLRSEPPRSAAVQPDRPPHTATRIPAGPAAALPDPNIDYLVELSFPSVLATSELAQQWKASEHRYATRAIFACDGGGAGWRRLSVDDMAPVESLRAGLQLVTREGPLSEAELIEFRAAVETLAAATGATVNAPEIRHAAETARALDRFCEESDIQVVVHVVGAGESALQGARIRATAEASGLALEEEGRFALRDDEGRLLYALSPRDEPGFEAATLDAAQLAGVSLTLDVPRVPDLSRAFQSMARFATHLAAALDGRLVDDNGNPLDERALAAIGAQLDAVRGGFDARGIATGSASALRLFF
jgi:ZipA-like protein with FtsZ-binding domain